MPQTQKQLLSNVLPLITWTVDVLTSTYTSELILLMGPNVVCFIISQFIISFQFFFKFFPDSSHLISIIVHRYHGVCFCSDFEVLFPMLRASPMLMSVFTDKILSKSFKQWHTSCFTCLNFSYSEVLLYTRSAFLYVPCCFMKFLNQEPSGGFHCSMTLLLLVRFLIQPIFFSIVFSGGYL